MADDIVLSVQDLHKELHEGRIHEEGTPDEVLKHPREERTRQFLERFTAFRF